MSPMPKDVALTRCLAAGWRRVAFVGLTKHAGKTTALNAFIRAAEEAGQTVGLCSIGLDGERLDSLLGVEKPAIFAPAGTLVASAEKALEQTGVQVEWLEQLPISSPMGPVMLARLTAPGSVLLAGVRQRQHVQWVLPRLAHYGAKFSLVDGAFDRIAAAAPHLVDAAVIAVGATAGKNVGEVVKAALPFLRRFQLPETPELWKEQLEPAHTARQTGVWSHQKLQLYPAHQGVFGLTMGAESAIEGSSPAATLAHGPESSEVYGAESSSRSAQAEAVYLPGALTDGLCVDLAGWPAPLQIVVDHPAQVLASDAALRRLFRVGHSVSVWRKLPIAAVAVNPHSILGYQLSWQDLTAELARYAPDLPFYDALTGREMKGG